MLKVSGSKPDGQARVEVDPYVPLTVELDSSGAETPLYWRGRTEEGSLVEVGLSPTDGSLCSMTLTSISRERVVRSGLGYQIHAGEFGVPRVDISLWSGNRLEFAENFFDEMVPLHLLLGESTATVCFSRYPDPVSWQQLDNILFGVTEKGFLCCIEVRGLSEVQIATIVEAVDR
jgi:hypothetical protein